MLLYVAGPYSAGTPEGIDKNIEAARQVAIDLWQQGHAVICPHLNTAHFEMDCTATYEQYMAGDFQMIARCDALVMVPGWQASQGAQREVTFATARSIPIYEWPLHLPLHVTEQRSPEQSRGFIDIVMQMYRTHLRKNADYSPANILGTGEIGLVTRLWDKTARLMSLVGFRMEIAHAWFEAPSLPQNESIEDSYMDGAVYNIIGLLQRRGLWGH